MAISKEDIEELGWVHIPTPEVNLFRLGNKELLTWQNNYTHLRIREKGSGIVTYFQGNVHDKSELKKLMDQLEIKLN